MDAIFYIAILIMSVVIHEISHGFMEIKKLLKKSRTLFLITGSRVYTEIRVPEKLF